jgi:hypothetical protein
MGDLLASLSVSLLRGLIFGGGHLHGSLSLLLLLLLEMVHVDGMGLVDLADEELVVCEKLLGVNNRLIQEHSSDDTSDLVAVDCLNGGINAVTHEILSIFSLHVVKVGEVHLWKLKEVLLLILGILVSTLGAGLFVIAILLLATLMTLVLL